jgi:hypothetical protein
MTKRLTGRRLIALAGVGWLWACSPKVASEPPPRTPAAAETPPDAGLPAQPLARKGVIVPSDVKLQTAPNETSPAAAPSGPSTTLGGN